jgi:hypothetical protein
MTRAKFSTIVLAALWVCIVERPAQADVSQWFLMSRHGERAEISSLTRKVPDLGDVRDPSAFIKLMRDKGYQVTLNEVSTPNGKVVEVKVPERELPLMFVLPEVCPQSGRE